MEPYAKGFTHPFFKPINFRDYRNYLPTAYDNSLDMYQQMTQVLQFCNEIGILNQDMSNNWNMLLSWIETNGVDEAVTGLLNQWVIDGTMAEIINKTSLKEINKKLDDLQDKVSEDLTEVHQYVEEQMALANQNIASINKSITLRMEALSKNLTEQVSNIANGVRGTYATLAELQSAKPNGDTGTYVVLEDGKWYYWNGSAWTAGGVYQATQVPAKVISKQGTINMAEDKGITVTSSAIGGEEFWFARFPLCFITNYNGDKTILLDPDKPINKDNNGFDLSHIGGKGGYICWSNAKNTIVTYQVGEKIADDDIIIGFAWYNGEFHFNGKANYTFNNRNEHQYYPELAMYNGEGNDWRIEKTDTSWNLHYSSGWITNGSITQLIEDGIVDATSIKDHGGWIVVDRLKKVSVSTTDKPIPVNTLVVGIVWGDGRVFVNGHTQRPTFEYGFLTSYGQHTDLDYLTAPATNNIFLSIKGALPKVSAVSGIYDITETNADGIDLTGIGKDGGPLVYDRESKKLYGTPKANLKDLYDRHVIVGWCNIDHVVLYTDIPYSINGVMQNTTSAYTRDFNILTAGDSVTRGYLSTASVAKHPYPDYIAGVLKTSVTNVGVSGKFLSGDTDGDLLPVLKANDLTKYQLITIAYGINDWNDGFELTKVATRLQESIDYIWSKNPSAYILGITPSPVWRHTGDDVDLTTPNSAGDNQKVFIDKLVEVYKSNQIPVYNFVDYPAVTKKGWHTQSVDGIHPTQATHKRMGARIANFIKTVI